MDDAISRQAVLKLLSTMPPEEAITKAMLIQNVKYMSAAQPKSYREGYQAGFKDAQSERKRGKWIDYTDEGYVECPFCHSATNCDGNEDELHFCFSCGADMREDDHEAR